jgi:hypothetical protein
MALVVILVLLRYSTTPCNVSDNVNYNGGTVLKLSVATNCVAIVVSKFRLNSLFQAED